MNISFRRRLLKWYAANPRSMPWKETKDPYHIWLSEIILQQTRVAQGLPYYERISKKFPTVYHLANAAEDEVLQLWEGLGYYTRARNLHSAARQVLQDYHGVFPSTYEEILKLKGVGAYSAAAIASFAFDLPHAVVDGNVFRVLARYFGISNAVDSTAGKKLFAKLAHDLLDKNHPADYNQAIMNFGALVCRPANPACDTCIFNKTCVAFLKNAVMDFPVKEKKASVRNRWFNFLIMENEREIIIERRNNKDIWKGLYQFPLIETNAAQTENKFLRYWKSHPFFYGKKILLKSVSRIMLQQLTHQTIYAQFFTVKLQGHQQRLPAGWQMVKKSSLPGIAFPVLIRKYLTEVLE